MLSTHGLLPVLLLLLSTSLLIPFPSHAQSSLETKLTASDARDYGNLGSAVALSNDGSLLAVGGFGDDSPYFHGKAYVFSTAPGPWTEQAKLLSNESNSSGTNTDSFGKILSVSGDGMVLAVAAQGDNLGTGVVYLYHAAAGASDGTDWDPPQAVRADDLTSPDSFGPMELSADGELLAVGAPGQANSTGAVYVFQATGGAWAQSSKLVPSDAAENLVFGTGVGLSEDGLTLAACARSSNTPGSVYVLKAADRSWTDWSQAAKFTGDDTVTADNFGFAMDMALDGRTIVVGAISDASSAGAAYVFSTLDDSQWFQAAKLTASDAGADDEFGSSVAMDSYGLVAAVGAHTADTASGTDSGSVYIFELTDGSWSESAALTSAAGNSFDDLGKSVALSADGRVLAVGAEVDDAAALNAGSAHVFTCDAGNVRSSTACTACAAGSYCPTPWKSLACPAGHYCPQGSSQATPCPSDTYSSSTSAASDTVCTSCTGSAHCPSGSTVASSPFELVLQEPSPVSYAYFGLAVAIARATSTTAAIGRYRDTGSGTFGGIVFIYSRPTSSSSSWSKVAEVASPESSATTGVKDRYGESVALSGAGTVLAVGAAEATVGKVYVYVAADAVNFALAANFTGSDSADNSQFGDHVTMSGDGLVLVTGATAYGTGSSGTVYVFLASAADWSEWSEVAKLTPTPGSANLDRFGAGLSISADGYTIAAGQHGEAGGIGSVRIFTSPDRETWTEVSKLLASDGAADWQFGRAVALSEDGKVVVVGSNFHDGDGEGAGRGYVFAATSEDRSTWNETGMLRPADAAAGDRIGARVAISADGQTVALGTPGDDSAFSDSGSVYVFVNANGSAWEEAVELTSAGTNGQDDFGVDVALDSSGRTLFVGAHADDRGGPNTGTAHIFTCAAGGLGSVAGNVCNACTAGSYCPTPWKSVACPAGHYCPQGSSQATPCPSGTYSSSTSAASDTTCIACPDGSVCPEGSTEPQIQQCAAGFYCLDEVSNPTPCPAGTWSDTVNATSSTTCEACTAGHYCEEASTTPMPCAAGTWSDTVNATSNATCEACTAGHYCEEGSTAPMPCLAGTWSDSVNAPSASTCETCTAGHYCPSPSTTTLPCPAGTWSDTVNATDSTTCEACTSGHFCEEASTTPMPCTAGTWSDTINATSATTCDACTAGHYCPSPSTTPMPCTAGTWSDTVNATDSTTCEACTSGHYCPSPSTSRTPCPAGTWSESPNADSINACTGCSAGNYCPSPASSPTACPAGSHSSQVNATNATTCQACPPAHYCSEGAPSPVACPEGTYSNATSATSMATCQDCPEHLECPEGSAQPGTCPVGEFNNGTACEECPAASYCPSASTSPTSCSAGFYCPSRSSDQTPCPCGQYCPSSSDAPVPCHNGSYNAAGGGMSGDDCTVCPSGTYCPDTGSCNPTDCPPGSSCAEPGATEHALCIPGSFSASANASECDPCPAGTYCNEEATTTPTPCTAGTSSTTTSATDASVCTDCATGRVSDDGAASCLPCLSGKFSSAAADECVDCASGRFAATPLQTECQDCSPGRYSGTGAVGCLRCPEGEWTADNTTEPCFLCSDHGLLSDQTNQTHPGVCIGDCPSGSEESGSLCVAASASSGDSSSSIAGVDASIAAIGGVLLVIVLLTIAVVLWLRRTKRRPDTSSKTDLPLGSMKSSASRLSSTSRLSDMGQHRVVLADLEGLDEEHVIGQGAFGKVFRCRYYGQAVVVKEMHGRSLDEEAGSMLRREAELLNLLDKFGGVPKLTGICDEGDRLLLVMQDAGKNSLEHILHIPFDPKRHGSRNSVVELPFSDEERFGHVAKLMLGVAQTVRYMHEGLLETDGLRVVHGDIASRNVVVELRDGELVAHLTDLGLAKEVTLDDGDAVNLDPGTKVPLWQSAPETIRSGKVGPASDVWQFGCFIWELVTRQRPFNGSNNDEVRRLLLKGKSPLEFGEPQMFCPDSLRSLVARCLRSKASRRPTMKQVVGALKRIQVEHRADEDDQVELGDLRGRVRAVVMGANNYEQYAMFSGDSYSYENAV